MSFIRESKRKMNQETTAGLYPISSSDQNVDKITKKDIHQESKGNSKRYGLVSFCELPEYMKDNEFILNYYRANWPLKEALFSIFRWHNETLNVWTHLIGFIIFLAFTVANVMEVSHVVDLINFFTRSFPISGDANVSDDFKNFFMGTTNLIDLQQMDTTPEPIMPVTRWPLLVFLAGAMFCLLSSSICHLFACHSRHLNIILLQIDYTGITVMIITSFFPPIYYIFQCESHWHFIYLGGITAMGTFTIVTLLSPSLSSGKFRAFRALLFSSMGLFGFVPAVHAVIVNWDNQKRGITLAYESAMAVFYLTGAVFYVARIPERWKPGWFDIAGHSHQIFHLLVVFGALAHYAATLVFLEWRDRVGCTN